MNGINAKFFDFLEIGDNHPTVFMGVLNISPESFYSGSVYEDSKSLEVAVSQMIENGAKILDLGARSTAPWSRKITVEEEVRRIVPAMEIICKIIPDDVIITIDTQYSIVAKKTHDISLKYGKKIILNDVSCLKTDPTLVDFIIEAKLPIILMASKNLPGDICNVEEIINEFTITIEFLRSKGYDEQLIILDPGIGKWIKEKTYEYDLKIINHLEKLRILKKPLLIAISRKSFIGTILNISEPEKRLDGTLSATVISIYNGAHIVRTHDISPQLSQMATMARIMRKNK